MNTIVANGSADATPGVAARAGRRTVSARKRLTRQFLLVALLPLLLVALLVGYLSGTDALRAIDAQNAAAAAAMRSEVGLLLAGPRQAARSTASELLRSRADAAAAMPLLAQALRASPAVDAMVLADARGRAEAVALRHGSAAQQQALLGIDLSARPFHALARQRAGPVWSDTFLSTLTGEVTAALALPVGERLLVTELSLVGLSQAIAAQRGASDATLVVLDAKGRIIGHADPEKARRRESLSDQVVVREALQSGRRHGKLMIDGRPMIGGVERIDDTDWLVLVAQPRERLLAPLQRVALTIAIGLAAALVLALVMARTLARDTASRYENLLAAAHELAEHPERAPVAAPRFDIAEAEQLWTSLSRLIDRLRLREQQTEAAKRDLQAVLDAATEVAIIATDRDGLVTMFNRGAEKLLGTDAAAVIGRRRLTDFHDDGELRRRAIELSQQFGRLVGGFGVLTAPADAAGYEVRDWRWRRADGTPIDVSLAVTALRDDSGPVTGYLGVASDQTARRRAAALDAARRQAEAASAAKTQFLSRMSHELRTPMNAMLGFAQLLRLDPAHPLHAVQLERVERIETAGWHLVRLIDDVLDLSRIESGTLRVSIEAVDVDATLAEVQRLVAALAAARGVTLVPAAPEPSAAARLALADRTRLTQVLVNLLTNAIKYNRPGGRVTLQVGAPAPGRLAIDIADTGRGMDESQLARLFEPFERLGMEDSAIEGTGIGLVIVKRLVDLMDGRIEVRSRPGEGTQVHLELRAADAPDAAAPQADGPTVESADTAASTSVVCIEDNPVNATLMQQVFALRPACRLHLASTAAQGLALVRRLRPRLVLLDLHLPDGSGLDLLQQLRADPLLAAIAVIVVSADATAGSVRAAEQAGARAYLAKPIEIASALQQIDAALAGA